MTIDEMLRQLVKSEMARHTETLLNGAAMDPVAELNISEAARRFNSTPREINRLIKKYGLVTKGAAGKGGKKVLYGHLVKARISEFDLKGGNGHRSKKSSPFSAYSSSHIRPSTPPSGVVSSQIDQNQIKGGL